MIQHPRIKKIILKITYSLKTKKLKIPITENQTTQIFAQSQNNRALKSFRKYPSVKSSHQRETSQAIYNVNEISSFCVIGTLSRKAFP